MRRFVSKVMSTTRGLISTRTYKTSIVAESIFLFNSSRKTCIINALRIMRKNLMITK